MHFLPSSGIVLIIEVALIEDEVGSFLLDEAKHLASVGAEGLVREKSDLDFLALRGLSGLDAEE